MLNPFPSSSRLQPRPRQRRQAMASVVEIDPSGDLLVAIGPANHLVRINSHILCSVSPVFKAMLGRSMSG